MPSIRSTRVVTADGVRPATVRWEKGTIVDIGDGEADHDLGDLVVLPGLVDSHVHVNEPGRTEWEGFATATRAARAGGTTTIVDMPLNSIPPTTTLEALRAKQSAAEGEIEVDVAFWGGIVPGSGPHVPELVAAGVCGFKVFLADSGVPEFPAMTVADLGAGVSGLPLLVHAESDALLGEPGPSYDEYLASRPPEAEASAIREVASVEGPLHILHVSSAEAVQAVSEHAGITAETCPHYLTFTSDDVTGPLFKCAPPIRGIEHRESLWEGLRSGSLAMVVSDHSPASPELKTGDFATAWGGIASLELRLPATWNGASERGFDFDDLARWLAAEPARLAGLDHAKGSIEVGQDADFAIFDPDGVTVVRGADLHQRHPITPYEGMTLRGRVVDTMKASPARMLTRR